MYPDPFQQAPIAREIWDLKYRLKAADGTPVDATIDDTWWRVARAAAGVEKGGKRKREAWAARFHGMLADFTFLPAGRIIAGAGTGRRVTLFNCFVLDTIEDDLGSIFDNVKQAALTMQQGGGIGHDFSTLRPQGAPVRSTGSDASGPVNFMDVWDAMCRSIMSAGSRRGAMMGTMRCDHPDIEAFIAAKAQAGRLRNFNLSVLVTDQFIAAVRGDRPWDLVFGGKVYRTLPARVLWDRLMRATYDYAEPGVIFIDRINALNNLGYCETIQATNPCVTDDTWIHTSTGPRQVRDLVGRSITVRVNGADHQSGIDGFFTTGRKPVLRLETQEGYSLRLTSDHRVRCVTRSTRRSLETDWRAAGDLRPGDLVLINDHRRAPEWGGELTRAEGYLLGLLIGDGTLEADKAVISVWWPATTDHADDPGPGRGIRAVMSAALTAAQTMPHRSDFAGWMRVADRNEYRMALGGLKSLAERLGVMPSEKQITPGIEQASSEFYRGFLRGLFDADGSVQGTHAKGVGVRLAQSDLARLEAVQRMLLRLGIASSLYRERRPAGSSLLPDGRGGQSRYSTVAQHEIVISGENLLQFQQIVGFEDLDKRERLDRAIKGYRRKLNRERFTARIKGVTPDGVEDVFDIQVPGLNAFDANGMLAHNCGEQPLPPNGACLLGSINLARLVDRPFSADAALDMAALEARVRLAVRFLDNVIDVSGYPLEAQRREAMAKRRIGLGLTGLADALIFCGLGYGTPAGRSAAVGWMAAIERAAYLASAEIAAEKGAFPLYDAASYLARPGIARLPDDVRHAIEGRGIRNGCLTSIAPTGTISLLAGNVSGGVEPVFDLEYRRGVRQPDGSRREEDVADFAYSLFRARFGADTALPPSFVTAAELSPHDHLEMQAALQRHVDSSISKTINCPVDLSFDAFKSVYLDAYDLGLKGCTTFRPNAVTGAVLTSGQAVTPTPAKEPPRAAPAGLSLADASDLAGSVIYMAKPLERDAALPGYTYKLKWPGSDHAIYVTLNDIERDGRRRPFEIFINTKNLEHYAWTVALTRMISAVFRRGGDVSFVVEELKAVFDPQGGHWIAGRYVPSLLAAIGGVIETHMLRTGFMQSSEATLAGERERQRVARPDQDHDDQAPLGQPRLRELRAPTLDPSQQPAPTDRAPSVADAGSTRFGAASPTASSPAASSPASSPVASGPGKAARSVERTCPRCSAPSLVRQEGCWVCTSCGYSRCG